MDGPSQIKCACKTLRPKASLSEKREFLAEAGIMAQFKHPNVVSLLGVVLDGEPIVIVLELMPEGALVDYLTKNRGELELIKKIEVRDMRAAPHNRHYSLGRCRN